MLATAADLANMPLMANNPARPLPWLNKVLVAADAAVKNWIKKDPELAARLEYYDGLGQTHLVIRSAGKAAPLWVSQTDLAAPSIGQSLPQSTINVVSTQGFHPGTLSNPNVQLPIIGVQTGASSVSFVTYTGTTPTSFTGCSGGTGTMYKSPQATNAVSVYSPVVWYDPQGARGMGPTSFGPGTQMVLGQQYMVEDDAQGSGNLAPLPVGVRASRRALIRRWGGGGFPTGGWWPFPQIYGAGDKLAGTREPFWQQGRGCVKVAYASGFLTPPEDLQFATLMLVAQMVRVMPNGVDMTSESLGMYTYSVLQDSMELGTIRTTLRRWREPSWGSGA